MRFPQKAMPFTDTSCLLGNLLCFNLLQSNSYTTHTAVCENLSDIFVAEKKQLKLQPEAFKYNPNKKQSY